MKQSKSPEDQALAVETPERFQIPHPPVEVKLDLSGLELVAEAIKYPGLCLGFLEVSGLDSPGLELHQLKVPEFLPVGQCLPAHHLLERGFPEAEVELEQYQRELDWLVLDLFLAASP